MSNAANEPRRWRIDPAQLGVLTEDAAEQLCVGGKQWIPVIEAAAYDALLAERDALLASLADSDSMHAMITHDNAALKAENATAWGEQSQLAFDCYALTQELAALKEKAAKVHEALRDTCASNYSSCELCGYDMPCLAPRATEHDVTCPAHPAFLTTSATESREAKGGTT